MKDNNPSVFVIDNRALRKDWFYIALLFLAVAVFIGFAAVSTRPIMGHLSLMGVAWLLTCYGMILIIPLSLLRMRHQTILEVTDAGLLLREPGLAFPPTVFIPREHLVAVNLDAASSRRRREPICTLNLHTRYAAGPPPGGVFATAAYWMKRFWHTRRIILAPFAHPEEKQIIFRDLEAFLRSNGFAFTSTSDWEKSVANAH